MMRSAAWIVSSLWATVTVCRPASRVCIARPNVRLPERPEGYRIVFDRVTRLPAHARMSRETQDGAPLNGTTAGKRWGTSSSTA
jgi:riboflavin biosynthesis pyrimidine reductase